MLAQDKFKTLSTRSSSFLENFRKQAISPNNTKTLKEWKISDVSAMVGKTTQTLRNLEKEGKIKLARKRQNGKKTERVYNLKEINELREYFDVRPSKPKNKKPMILGIANFKGGSTKSTSTLTISQALALRGYKVLVIDGDSQGTSTHLGGGYIPDLHIEAKQTILDILVGSSKSLKNCIIKTHWDSLDIIPANLSLYNSEMVIPFQIHGHRQKTGGMLPFYSRLRNALEQVSGKYDIVIIDTPPSLGFITLNVLYAVNSLLIPLIPSEVDYCSTTQFLTMVSESIGRLPDLHYNFVKLMVTRYRPHSIQDRTMAEAIKGVFGSDLMTNYMIETDAVSKASSDMRTIFEVEPHKNDRKTFNRAIEHINKLVDELEMLFKETWLSMSEMDLDKEILLEDIAR